jgi:hypothetical protein
MKEDLKHAKAMLDLMETHVKNNEIKLLRLGMGMDKVVESSERTEKKLNEMVDDVATLRTRVAHLREDIDDLMDREMNDGRVYKISGMVVGAAIAVATAVLALIKN